MGRAKLGIYWGGMDINYCATMERLLNKELHTPCYLIFRIAANEGTAAEATFFSV